MQRIARFALYSALVLFSSIAVAALVGFLRFGAREARVYDVPKTRITLDQTPTALARGEHLVRGLAGCTVCHGADLGGRVHVDSALFRAVAPNLTLGQGSAVLGFSAGDWSNAIVHGVNQRGTSLFLMPSKEVGSFADDDVAAMIGYLRTVPRVDRDPGKSTVSLLGRIVIGLFGMELLSAEPIDHRARRAIAPEVSPTPVYGNYLSNVCRGCHGADLRGGIVIHPGAPPSANISSAVMKDYDFDTFERALRQGTGRDGHPLADDMPWKSMKNLSNDELRALWLGLRQE